MTNFKSCNNCIFAYFKDFGYSNYTVEGTEFNCLKNKHPDGSFDRWYGEADKLDFAEKCKFYKNGLPVLVDTDEEEIPYEYESETPIADYYAHGEEQQKAMKKFEIKQNAGIK